MSFIPIVNLGGSQQPAVITNSTPVYSCYTGELIGSGPIPIGTICDSPPGSGMNGQPYHVIEAAPNGTFMAFGMGNRFQPSQYRGYSAFGLQSQPRSFQGYGFR